MIRTLAFPKPQAPVLVLENKLEHSRSAKLLTCLYACGVGRMRYGAAMRWTGWEAGISTGLLCSMYRTSSHQDLVPIQSKGHSDPLPPPHRVQPFLTFLPRATLDLEDDHAPPSTLLLGSRRVAHRCTRAGSLQGRWFVPT